MKFVELIEFPKMVHPMMMAIFSDHPNMIGSMHVNKKDKLAFGIYHDLEIN